MKLFPKNHLFKDIIQFYAVYLFVVVAVYKTPTIVALIIQVGILYVFYNSKKDYFWFAFIFIVSSTPASFFTVLDAANTLSLFPTSPIGVLYFWIVFLMFAAVKAFNVRPQYPFFLTGIVVAMLIYLVIQLMIFKIANLGIMVKGLMPWILVFALPRLLVKKSDYENFFNIVFSFSFFVLISQLFFLVSATEFNTLLGGLNTTRYDLTIESADQALRPVSGIMISYVSIMGSTFFYVHKDNIFTKNYLLLVLAISFISVFITATRGWMLGSVLIILVFAFLISKNPLKLIPKLFLPALVLILLFKFVPFLNKQFELSFSRYETLTALVGGDKTAGGTLSRLDDRPKKVMKKFWESPILGWGYGPEKEGYSDGHVGNQNLLLSAGILGYSLMAFLWIAFMFKLFLRDSQLNSNNPYKKVPLLLISFMLSMILIHSTSSQWFGYGFGINRGFTLFFVIAFANHVYWHSVKYERLKDFY